MSQHAIPGLFRIDFKWDAPRSVRSSPVSGSTPGGDLAHCETCAWSAEYPGDMREQARDQQVRKLLTYWHAKRALPPDKPGKRGSDSKLHWWRTDRIWLCAECARREGFLW